MDRRSGEREVESASGVAPSVFSVLGSGPQAYMKLEFARAVDNVVEERPFRAATSVGIVAL